MITKITTTPAGGLPHDVNDILAKKCRVFIGKGIFETDIPDTKAELKALWSGAGAVFIPLGDLDEEGSYIEPKQKTIKLGLGTVAKGWEITGQIKGVTINKDMLNFVKSIDRGLYSLLFVPDGDDATFYALSGIHITTDLKLIVLDGDNVSNVIFYVTRDTDNLTSVVLLDKMAS